MRWRAPSHIAWVESKDDAVQGAWLLNAERNMIFALSDAGLAIWCAAEGADSVSVVLDRLVAEYGWDRAEITEPVDQFVKVLVEQGFLEEVGA